MGRSETVVLCVDGSDASVDAVSAGFRILPQTARVVIVTVVESDPTLVTGAGGHAGGVMSEDEFVRHEEALDTEGRSILERAAAAIEVTAPETRVIRGEPGRALCDLATELPAAALVLGTRGRGGLKRALLGSVSDYVVRNAPCPVVITFAGT